MSSVVEQLGIENLLLPFPGETPSGIDPRQDFSPSALYRALRTARSAARAAERAADAEPNNDGTPPVEWRTVRTVATKILAEIGKDLEVAAWLTEALVRSDGLRGMAAGMQLITGLTQRFWSEGMYPLPDDGSFADRISPVEGLSGTSGDGTIVQTLRKLTLFVLPEGTPIPLYKFKESVKLTSESDKAKIAQRLAAGAIAFSDLERGAKAVGGDHFAGLRRQAREALQALNDMAAVLDSAAGSEGPSVGRVRGVLEDILDVAQRFAPPEAAEPLPGISTAEAADMSARTGEAQQGEANVEIADQPGAARQPARESREDMLRDLGRIAEYFRRTEPNSPLAGTLDEAIRRARLTFSEMLEELLPDANARGQVLTQLGMRMPKP